MRSHQSVKGNPSRGPRILPDTSGSDEDCKEYEAIHGIGVVSVLCFPETSAPNTQRIFRLRTVGFVLFNAPMAPPAELPVPVSASTRAEAPKRTKQSSTDSRPPEGHPSQPINAPTQALEGSKALPPELSA